MLYNVHGFQQAQLIQNGLDNDDALILRVITDMYASPKMEQKLVNNKRYIWINQDYLARQIPCTGGKRKIVRRINEMIAKGFISSITKYSKTGKAGTFYYIMPTSKVDSLRDIEPYDKMSLGSGKPYDKMSQEGMTKCHTKDSINNKDTNITNNLSSADDSPPHKDIVEYLNAKTGKSFLHTAKATQRQINARLAEGFTVDDFKRVIDNKVTDWGNDNKMAEYLRPNTLFGTKFEGYLNSKTKRGNISVEESKYDWF